jgi:hypothetical protein
MLIEVNFPVAIKQMNSDSIKRAGDFRINISEIYDQSRMCVRLKYERRVEQTPRILASSDDDDMREIQESILNDVNDDDDDQLSAINGQNYDYYWTNKVAQRSGCRWKKLLEINDGNITRRPGEERRKASYNFKLLHSHIQKLLLLGE